MQPAESIDVPDKQVPLIKFGFIGGCLVILFIYLIATFPRSTEVSRLKVRMINEQLSKTVTHTFEGPNGQQVTKTVVVPTTSQKPVYETETFQLPPPPYEWLRFIFVMLIGLAGALYALAVYGRWRSDMHDNTRTPKQKAETGQRMNNLVSCGAGILIGFMGAGPWNPGQSTDTKVPAVESPEQRIPATRGDFNTPVDATNDVTSDTPAAT